MSTTPLPQLTPEQLRHAHAILTGALGLPAVEVTFRVAGVNVHVRERDLHFIHSLDATRFGSHAECPLCAAELAVDDRNFEEV